RGAQVLSKESAQLALAQSESLRQRLDVSAVQRAELDQRQGARYGVGSATPGTHVWRGLRSTAQARTKARLLRGGGRGIEHHVLGVGRACRTHRSAIDPRRLHGREEAPVEARVALRKCAVASVVVQIHPRVSATPPRRVLAVFGHQPELPPSEVYVRIPPARRSTRSDNHRTRKVRTDGKPDFSN